MSNPATVPLSIMSAIPLLAGGALHFRDWSRTYRAVPWEVPGAWVVRVGFPVNGLISVVLAVVLVAAAAKCWPSLRYAVAAAVGFQASSIAALVLSRQGSFFGWTEPIWSPEARQILAVEILTIVGLVALAIASRKSIRSRFAPDTP
ncbi:MAG TPA: hypothetical protein VMZ22_02800 [Acidimicrobiales bacterium]|nr:hypothetical protein [Acidimicrobiales bacterium]